MRALAVAACTLLAFACGVVSDVLANDEVVVEAGNVIVALMSAPIAVSVGGAFVADEPWKLLFLWGGLLFMPVYAVLMWWCLRTARWIFFVLLTLWCGQGFFRILLRFEAIMGV